MNEALLPVLAALSAAPPPRVLHLYNPKHTPQKPLPHWDEVTKAYFTVRSDAAAFFSDARRRCVRRIVWGFGHKPAYEPLVGNDYRSARGAVRHLRRALLGPGRSTERPRPASLPVAVYDTIGATIVLRRPGGGHGTGAKRMLGDVDALERRFRIDAHCCNFGAPLAEQMKLLSSAAVVVGLHGAGLANILFARRAPVLVELKASYGGTSFEYQRLTHLMGGGYAAVHLDEPPSVTEAHAASVHGCIVAIQRGQATACSRLPYIMQAWPIGHTADCVSREWPSALQAPASRLCPEPTWREAHGRRCWRGYVHTPVRHGAATACALRYNFLRDALAACDSEAWCGAVSSAKAPTACREKRYELRSPPVNLTTLEYRGRWTGLYTYVRLADAECLAAPDLLTFNGTTLRPPGNASMRDEAHLHQASELAASYFNVKAKARPRLRARPRTPGAAHRRGVGEPLQRARPRAAVRKRS